MSCFVISTHPTYAENPVIVFAKDPEDAFHTYEALLFTDRSHTPSSWNPDDALQRFPEYDEGFYILPFPQWDSYSPQNSVPLTAMLEEGWGWPCHECGEWLPLEGFASVDDTTYTAQCLACRDMRAYELSQAFSVHPTT